MRGDHINVCKLLLLRDATPSCVDTYRFVRLATPVSLLTPFLLLLILLLLLLLFILLLLQLSR